MKSIDVIGIMKTASSIVPLEGDNKFLVRWGNNMETVIVVGESRPTKRAVDGAVRPPKRCPVCLRVCVVKSNGRFIIHGPKNSRCKGSNAIYAGVPESPRN